MWECLMNFLAVSALWQGAWSCWKTIVLSLNINWRIWRQHVVPQHLHLLVLLQGAFTPVELVYPSPKHVPPDHQGAHSVLYCVEIFNLGCTSHQLSYTQRHWLTEKLKVTLIRNTTVSHCNTVQLLWLQANLRQHLMFAGRNNGFFTAKQPRSPADFKRFLVVEDDTVTPSSASNFCRSSGDVRQRPLRLYWTSAHFCLTDVHFGLPLRQPLTQSLSDASWCHKLFWHLPSLSTRLQTANAHLHQYSGPRLQLEACFSLYHIGIIKTKYLLYN